MKLTCLAVRSKDMERRVAMHRSIGLTILVALILTPGIQSCTSHKSERVIIPAASDWKEYGVVLEAGPPDSWDSILAGASSPSSIVKKDGRYYLYYGGASGVRADNGPAFRSLGVATSPDGIRFTKYENNPVVVHRPTGLDEEGANSAAVMLDHQGRFVMFYGAATQINAESINADARLALSEDGLHFELPGPIVLDHRSPSLFGGGDEIFPLSAYHHAGRWFVYYVPNGGRSPWSLGVAWGMSPTDFRQSAVVVQGSRDDPVRVGGNVARLGKGRIAVFVQRGWHPDVRVEVRTAYLGTPHILGPPVEVYDNPLWNEETKFLTAFLDRERRTWFLYRLNWKRQFVLHLAPAGEIDATPPTAPANLRGEVVGETVRLRWESADDPDTGVVHYRVMLDGEELGTTFDPEFEAPLPRGSVLSQYRVTAVNLHGVEGPAAETTLQGADNRI